MTEHFTLAELTFSQIATRRGINNTPDEQTIRHLLVLANGLERIRKLLGHPITISSGYRCPALNALVSKAKNSAHLDGFAADFVCRGYGSPLLIVNAIKHSDIRVDQCIEEGAWVHVSFAPPLRNQFLKATFKNGKATYTFI